MCFELTLMSSGQDLKQTVCGERVVWWECVSTVLLCVIEAPWVRVVGHTGWLCKIKEGLFPSSLSTWFFAAGRECCAHYKLLFFSLTTTAAVKFQQKKRFFAKQLRGCSRCCCWSNHFSFLCCVCVSWPRLVARHTAIPRNLLFKLTGRSAPWKQIRRVMSVVNTEKACVIQ